MKILNNGHALRLKDMDKLRAMGLRFKQTQVTIPNADEWQYPKELLQT
jgi:hypothetical protein